MKPWVSSQGAIAALAESLVDNRIGIINNVGEFPREPGAPEFFHYYAKAANTKSICKNENFQNAGGASAKRHSALAKAMGEAIERYCSAIYDIEECPLCCYEEAKFECVEPSEFALYSEEQYQRSGFPFVPLSREAPVGWTAARDLADGRLYHVPAAMVFLPYTCDRESGESQVVQPISTGLACHTSYEAAVTSAICEVIERDAFTITWQACLSMPQIRIETLSELTRDLVERFQRCSGSVCLVNITMDAGIPTILAVWRGRSPERPALAFAAAADLNSERAVEKSLEELAHTLRLAQELKANLPPLVPSSNFENIKDQYSHVRLYCDEANAPLAEFIFASKDRIDFKDVASLGLGDPKRQLELLAEKVRAVRHRVLVADLTTPDVAGLGLIVVRAIIPGFHPLFVGHRSRALGGSRLWEVPQKLGHQGITRESGDNPAPHPFP